MAERLSGGQFLAGSFNRALCGNGDLDRQTDPLNGQRFLPGGRMPAGTWSSMGLHRSICIAFWLWRSRKPICW